MAVRERPFDRVCRLAVRQPGDGCWLWMRGTNGHGYGVTHVGSVAENNLRQTYVHRVVWEHHYGPIPKGLDVCHSCDVRNCVRIEHLFLGSRGINMRDAARKGRVPRGEAHHNRKLTEDAVRVIRAAKAEGRKAADVGREFGVAGKQVQKIWQGIAWKHVPARPDAK